MKVPLPPPAKWLVCYGYVDRIGVYLTANWKENPNLWVGLAGDQDAIRREVDTELVFNQENDHFLGRGRFRSEFRDEDEQIDWLCEIANSLVNALIPRLRTL